MEELRYEIFSRLEEIPDLRVERTKVHSLPVLLFIALCTFLTGGKSFYEMELFAEAHKAWLKKVAGMVSVPSHDTFNRIFQAIKPEHFAEFLARFAYAQCMGGRKPPCPWPVASSRQEQ